MQVDDMGDLSFADVVSAFDTYRRNPKHRTPPLPSDIRNALTPEQTDEQMALDASSRIVQAMGKYGWPYPEKAKTFIGDLGWEVVMREGGWASLCQRITDSDVGVFRAQARELCKALIVSARSGKLNQAPSLPQPIGSQTLPPASGTHDLRMLAQQAVKSIPPAEEGPK